MADPIQIDLEPNMDRFWNLPPSFRYAVQNTPNPNIVKVYNGQGRGGETVHVEPFTRENLDIVQAMLKEVRLSENPVIKYMTNQAVDIERSGARSHVLGQILSKEEALHQHFELGPAAAEAQVNGMGNCDRVNALVYLSCSANLAPGIL